MAPTPNERIARGLNENEQAAGRPTPGMSLSDFESLIPAGTKQSSEGLLKELADSSRRRLRKLDELKGHVEQHVAKREQQARAQADELKGNLDRAQRQSIIRNARQKARREALQMHKEERDRLTAEINNAARQVPAWRETLGSPALYLSMKTLESRQGYMQALAHAGPAELRGALFNAIASQNPKLAAAVLAVADGRGVKVQDLCGASRDQIAARVVPEHSSLVEAITALEHAATDAESVIHDMESGKSDPHAKTVRGLRDKDKPAEEDQDDAA